MILKVPGPNSGALDIRAQVLPCVPRIDPQLEAGWEGTLIAQTCQAPRVPLEGI